MRKGLAALIPSVALSQSRLRRRPRRWAAPESLEERTLLAGYGTEQLTNLFAEGTAFPSSATGFVDVNGTTYFRARTPQHGWELWKTDGTEAGTVLVRDIRSGPSNSLPMDLTPYGNFLFFTVDRGFGRELWRTDGSSSGTRSMMFNGIRTHVTDLNLAGGKLYFTAEHNSFGRELWFLQTPTSTPALSGNLTTGAQDTHFQGFAEKDGFLYFAANGDLHWANANTITTFDTNGFTRAYDVINFNGTLFIDAEGGLGKGLYKSDGTDAGTIFVKDIRGSFNSHTNLQQMMPAPNNNGIMFITGTPATGSEPWFSDGTTAGTYPIDINPGSTGSFPSWNADSPANLGGYTYFYASNGTNGGELYRSDGTAAGTIMMADSTAGPTGGMTGNAGVIGGKVVFSGGRGSANSGLWVSDGTNAGTIPMLSGMTFRDPAPGSGTLFFTGDDGSGKGLELWSTMGTGATTQLVRDIGQTINSAQPGQFTPHGSKLFFTATDEDGTELWAANGAIEQVADINPGAASGGPANLTSALGSLFFRATDGTNGSELWKSDGTAGGTVLVHDMNPGADNSYPVWITEVGGRLFFSAETSNEGRELWTSDGTSAGTTLVTDIESGSGGSFPSRIIDFGGDAVFLATTSADSQELYRSDGTAAGTVQLSDLDGANGGADDILGVFDNHIFFTIEKSNGDRAIWKSDGTFAGTGPFLNVDVGSAQSFTALGDRFLFAADDKTWVSDGTTAGTTVLMDVHFSSAVVRDGVAYFGGFPDSGPNGMFRSDGTPEGTHHLFRMLSGDVPRYLTLTDTGITFVARSPVGRSQVWSFDGNRSSLRQLSTTQWSGQQPDRPGVLGSDIYFSAFATDRGVELYHLAYAAGPGIQVQETSGFTTVDTLGGTDRISVSLTEAPASDVVIDLNVPADLTASRQRLTFTPTDWQTPQHVTIAGPGTQSIDDEGDALYEVTMSVNDALSDDAYDDVPDAVVPVDSFVLPGTSFYQAFTTPNQDVTFEFLTDDTPAGMVSLDSFDTPGLGSIVDNGDGTATYTPNPNQTGTDTFDYHLGLKPTQSLPEAELQSRFGNAVATEADIAVVGAALHDANGSDSGAAWVLRRTGSEWREVAQLLGSTTTANDQFGTSVAIDNGTIVVSAPRDDVGGTNTGSVFVFRQNASGDWVETAHLTDPRGRDKDEFGTDVDIDGNTLAVGGRLDDGRGRNSGSAFIFDRESESSDWSFRKRIKPSDAAAFQQFGSSVSLSNDTLAVGAWKDDSTDTDAGAAYVFSRNAGGNNRWGEVANLQSPEPLRGDYFGFDVAIDGDSLLVGAPFDDVGSRANAGAAYMFRNDEAQGWLLADMLTETRLNGEEYVFAGGANDHFGDSVDLADGIALVGAPHDNGQGRNSGSAFTFKRSGNDWNPHHRMAKFKSASPSSYEDFGDSVALGNTAGDFFALVGAPKSDADSVNNTGAVHATYSRLATGVVRVNISDDTLLAEPNATPNHTDVPDVRDEDITAAVEAAISAWRQAGASATALSTLRETPVHVFDLPGQALGLATPVGIVVDTNAAGHGWSGASGTGMHLATVVAHEFGHVLGLADLHEDDQSDDLMFHTLRPGEQRSPNSLALDAVFADAWLQREIVD